jgi:SEC-C motif domain protein
MLAGRVIPWDGFLMTGGAMLPVAGHAARRVAEVMVREIPRDTDFTRLTRAQEADLTAMIIRACLEGGASEHIMYETPGEARGTGRRSPALPTRLRANRNDPCPCGSGRKYKSCCGKR